MGCSVSCSFFETFSTALQWLANKRCGISKMIHILDDFLIVSPSFSQADQSLSSFFSMCGELGVPMAPEKTVGPSQIITFAGLELDTVHFEIRLPQDKVEKCKLLVEAALSRRKIKLRELQSLIGSLSFACRVVYPGRAFLRRLIDLTIGIKHPHHFIRLNKSAKADLFAWSTFLSSFNGVRFISPNFWLESNVGFSLYTDASAGIGFGGYVDSYWFSGTWPRSWSGENITLLELFPIALSLHLWGATIFSNNKVIFYSDNSAIVSVLNKRSSREPKVMVLIRSIVLNTMQHNILFQARHVSGLANQPADALSRSQIQRFRRLYPSAAKTPTLIPPHLSPENWTIH